ncbi:MAG: hypothetical protein ACYDBB_24320 [Armatimonadota bacterium]
MKINLGLALSSLLLLVLVVGCTDNDDTYRHRHRYDYYGGVIIGPADHYRWRTDRDGHRDRDRDRDHDHNGRDRDDRGRGRGDGDPDRDQGRNRDRDRDRDNDRDRDRDRDRDNERRDDQGRRDRSSVDYLQITGYLVRPATGPVLDQFDLSVHNVQYQLAPFRVTGIGSTEFTARTTEAQINTFVNGRARSGNSTVRDVRFTFMPQEVQATATITLEGRPVTVVSTGTLQPEGKTRLVYVPGAVTADGVRLPAAAQQELVKQLNPVVDLTGLNVTTQIQQVTLEKGVTTLTGTAAPKKLP